MREGLKKTDSGFKYIIQEILTVSAWGSEKRESVITGEVSSLK